MYAPHNKLHKILSKVLFHQYVVHMFMLKPPDAYAEHTYEFLMHMLSAPISYLRRCSVHKLVPYTNAKYMHKFLMLIPRVDKMNIRKMGKLIHSLSVCLSY